jgi:hypothetical protein
MSISLLVDSEPTEGAIDPGRRRLGFVIWALLFVNGMAYIPQPLVVPFPGFVGKMLTQGALAAATILVLVFNRDRLIRPNLFLTLYSLLALFALMATLRVNPGLGVGSFFRAGRFLTFLAVLWLLTPLWGRRDRMLLQWHVLCLSIILSIVCVGFVIDPGKARSVNGRLGGIIWPVPATQVGHYAAMLSGLLFVLLLSRVARTRVALPLAVAAFTLLVFTHTRTALIAMVAGVIAATVALYTVRRRARRVAIVVMVGLLLLGTAFSSVASSWFVRGESSDVVGTWNGRTKVWNALLDTPRSNIDATIGRGLSNKTFNGLPIDNSWLVTYLDEGLVGVALCATIFISLLMLAATRPRGPSVAIAVFIVVYCAVASITETGVGDVSPYVLDLTLAAALLAPAPLRTRMQAVSTEARG